MAHHDKLVLTLIGLCFSGTRGFLNIPSTPTPGGATLAPTPLSPSITEIIQTFDPLLVDIINAAGMASTINQVGTTFFAPDMTGFSSIAETPFSVVTTDAGPVIAMLERYTVRFEIEADDLANNQLLASISGPTIRINRYNRVTRTLANGIPITFSNNTSPMGVVHVTSGIIPLALSLIEAVQGIPGISTFANMVTLSLLEESLLNLLTASTSQLTLFVPINDAFTSLPSSIINNKTALTDIMRSHIVGDVFYTPGLIGRLVTDLNGGRLLVRSNGEILNLSDGDYSMEIGNRRKKRGRGKSHRVGHSIGRKGGRDNKVGRGRKGGHIRGHKLGPKRSSWSDESMSSESQSFSPSNSVSESQSGSSSVSGEEVSADLVLTNLPLLNGVLHVIDGLLIPFDDK